MLSCFSRVQLYVTLCTVACQVHGILQARILEWIAMPFSRRSSQPGMEPRSLMSPALAGGLSSTSTWGAPHNGQCQQCYLSTFEKAGLFISQHNVNLKLKGNFSYMASQTLLWSYPSHSHPPSSKEKSRRMVTFLLGEGIINWGRGFNCWFNLGEGL